MKVKKFISIEQEIEFNVNIDDISQAISDDNNRVFVGINNIASYLKAIPDSTIQNMTSEERKIVKDFLYEQSKRF